MVKKTTDTYGDLYIPMHDVTEKRKNLLLSIKNSLIMQEEQDKIMAIRAQKAEVLKQIKKEMTGINTQYLKVKKFFPNIKNILSNTEKEISVLEKQIRLLKTAKAQDDVKINKIQEVEATLKETITKKSTKKASTKSNKKTVNKITKKISAKAKEEPKKPLTKKERVKANLKALESKLQKL